MLHHRIPSTRRLNNCTKALQRLPQGAERTRIPRSRARAAKTWSSEFNELRRRIWRLESSAPADVHSGHGQHRASSSSAASRLCWARLASRQCAAQAQTIGIPTADVHWRTLTKRDSKDALFRVSVCGDALTEVRGPLDFFCFGSSAFSWTSLKRTAAWLLRVNRHEY
jgi:hypothetical protein